MYKLVILVDSTANDAFDEHWPQFLHLAESIPGLLRETTCRVEQIIYGDLQCDMIHELYFESLAALQSGLASPSGVEAGRLLQDMTGGQLKLLISDHKQDELENIRKYHRNKEESTDA